MKIVVVGARGMLGTDLMTVLARKIPRAWISRTGHHGCRRVPSRRFSNQQPDLVINAAAFTNVDSCESHEDEALQVNGQGAGIWPRRLTESGAILVHYSTDYVFDGQQARLTVENDPTNPLSAYGRSKLRGEGDPASPCANHLILRTSWLFGRHGKNFIRTIVDAARAGQNLRVVDDQRGSPTYARDLAEQTWRMVAGGCRGIYHVTNGGACSWYELACRRVEWAGLWELRFDPVLPAEFPRPAPRPAVPFLPMPVWRREGLPLMRPWQEAARSYVSTCLRAQ